VFCDGACVNPQEDEDYCGARNNCAAADDGNVCSGNQDCSFGVCCDTDSGLVVCNGQCIDPRVNNTYCGAGDGTASCVTDPGVTCGAGQACSNGICCTTPQIACGGTCRDPRVFEAFCGASGDCDNDASNGPGNDGSACSGATPLCTNGNCCPDDRVWCGTTAGCIDPLTTEAFCGASETACAGFDVCTSTETCTNGTCVPTAP
jgi:hypothetical protein